MKAIVFQSQPAKNPRDYFIKNILSISGDRIAAMQIAHDRGIKTYISFEPVVDPNQTLHLIELTSFADKRFVGKMNHNSEFERTIDWQRFRVDAEALMQKLGLDYELKADPIKAAPNKKPEPKHDLGGVMA